MAESTTISPPIAGLVAEFDGPEKLKAAAAVLRDQGLTRWDVHSPFPIHGIERAMGMRPTRLPWVVLAAGICGGLVALAMQWWMNAVDYPLVISGKPLWSLPANIPITFELIVLLSGLAAFGGALMLGRLPEYAHFAHRAKTFGRVTTDGFFISVDAADARFDPAATAALIESLGATAVESCPADQSGRRIPTAVRSAVVVLCVLAVLPPLWIALAREQKSQRPRIRLVQDMDFQPKYRPQARSPLFADGRATRPPVPGTMARDQLQDDDHFYLGYHTTQSAPGPENMTAQEPARDYYTTFPPQVTGWLQEMTGRGRERFAIFCATCHGLLGDGRGMTSVRALEREEPDWVTPVSFHTGSVRDQAHGQLFHTITHGVRKMPAYGPQIPVEDRWAIVLYVRALQRSQNASADDVPEERRDQLR